MDGEGSDGSSPATRLPSGLLTFSARLPRHNGAGKIARKHQALLGDPNDLNSYSNKLRSRRDVRLRALIARIAKEKGSVDILDVGGALEYWQRVGLEFLREQKAQVTLLNLPIWAISPITGAEDIFKVEVGDGCDLSQYADNSFDLTHSNSVVEHVITWANMKAFAAETRRVGRYYYVQTPNYWFPIDPHFYHAPFFHWMPTPLRAFLLTHFHVAYSGKVGTLDEAYQILDEHRLIDRTRFRQLFPDSKMEFEPFMLLPKSMVGVREP
jgi:hypothetical protein